MAIPRASWTKSGVAGLPAPLEKRVVIGTVSPCMWAARVSPAACGIAVNFLANDAFRMHCAVALVTPVGLVEKLDRFLGARVHRGDPIALLGPAALGSSLRPGGFVSAGADHLAYLIGAGLMLVAIAIAFTALRARIPELAPEPVPNLSSNRSQQVWACPPCSRGRDGRATGVHGPPLPASLANPCEDAGMGVTIGCGGCAARRRRLRRRHGQRLRADSGEDFLDPDDPTLFPAHARAGRVPGGDRHPGVMRTRGARLGHGQRDTPLYVVLRSLGRHRPSAGGRPLLHPMQGGTFAADISMFTGEPTLAAGFRGRTNIAP